MEKITSNLITALKNAKTKAEIISIVDSKHKELKNKLVEKGTKFSADEHLADEQWFHGKEDGILARSYQEVNHIRRGVKHEWVTMVSERERYDPITNDMKEILEGLE